MYKQRRRHNPCEHVMWWVVGLLLVGLLVTAIVLLATHPYPVSSYYRDNPNAILRAENCTIGEHLDGDLNMCAPIVNHPVPVLESLKDHTVDPCDSFFHSQSGAWLKTHSNSNRAFNYVYRRNQKLIHDIIRDPKEGPIYRFYRSCVDTLVNGKHQALDRTQMKHVREHIMGSFKSHADLPVVFARLASYGFTSPFSVTIESHPTEPRMVPLIRYDGFSIDAITQTNVGMDVYKMTFLTEAVRKLNALKDNDDEEMESFVDYVNSARYKLDMTTMGSLLDISPRNFWKLYLRELNGYAMESEMDMAGTPAWIVDRSYMRNLFTGGLQSLTVEEWKAFFTFSIRYNTYNFVPELPSDAYFRTHQYAPMKKMAKVPHRMQRSPKMEGDLTCLALTHRMVPGLISRAFLSRFMPNYEATRTRVIEIVERIRDTMANIINRTPWMDPTTKAKTVAKIRAIVVRAVRPNFWEEEPFADRITIDNYLRNINLVRRYRATHNFELWTSGTPNRDLIQRFSAPLTEINAFYAPTTNTITMFAGILMEPFYSDQYAEVVLYATIGMIAAHELGHAIDFVGHWFDKDGNIPPGGWWTTQDVAQFNERAQCIVREYDEGVNDCQLDNYGQQTLSENMADILGIRTALEAAPIKNDQDRRFFFETFAQLW
jgi:predicted metalloendopeptidase